MAAEYLQAWPRYLVDLKLLHVNATSCILPMISTQRFLPAVSLPPATFSMAEHILKAGICNPWLVTPLPSRAYPSCNSAPFEGGPTSSFGRPQASLNPGWLMGCADDDGRDIYWL